MEMELSALAMVMIGAVVSVVTQLAKKTGMKSQVVLGTVCLLAAAIYTAFKDFAAPDVVEAVFKFFIQTWGIANILYSIYKMFLSLVEKK